MLSHFCVLQLVIIKFFKNAFTKETRDKCELDR